MNNKRIPVEERYKLVSEWYNTRTGEVEILDPPVEVEVKSNGKAHPTDKRLFHKFYKDKLIDIAEACSRNGDCFYFLEFILYNLQNGKFQAVCCSRPNLSEIFGWSMPKLDRVVSILKELELLYSFNVYNSVHYVVNHEAIWNQAENVKWKGNKAVEGEFKSIRTNMIIKEEDIVKNKERRYKK